MKDEINFLIAMTVLILVGSATLIYSQSGSGARTTTDQLATPADMPPPPDGFRRGPGQDIFATLDLTYQQQEQISTIKANSRVASREFEGKMRAADDQLRMMVESGAFDVEKATPLVRAKADAMSSIELIRLSSDAGIQNLLTTDQKAQLAQARQQRPSFPPGSGFGPPER